MIILKGARMKLTDKQIKEFQRRYEEYYGFPITFDDAREEGVNLVRLMKMIYKPITREELGQLDKFEND